VLEAYACEVKKIARSRNPTDTIKKVRRAWNKLVDAFPDELTFRARTWKDHRQWGLPVEVMPKSFQREMALFKAARSPETFEEVFRCRPLKHAKAVRNQCGMIMRIVAAMHMNGHPLSNFTSFRYIVQLEPFEETMRALKRLTGAVDLRQLGPYAHLIYWLAETWLQVSDSKLRKLKKAMGVVGRRKVQIADSSLDVLEQLDDPIKREKVRSLADEIYAEFRAKGAAVNREDAAEFRNALYWDLGLTTGWRPFSRARINFQDDIQWSGRKGRQVAILTAPKKSEKIELRRKVELSLASSQMLRYYINHALPLLRIAGDDENPHLFPGRHGGAHLSSPHLSNKSAELIALRAHVVGASGHKSRHVAVKFHLTENPGDWETAQEHVGHQNPETTKRFLREYHTGRVLQACSKIVEKALKSEVLFSDLSIGTQQQLLRVAAIPSGLVKEVKFPNPESVVAGWETCVAVEVAVAHGATYPARRTA
jgi:integrase